MRDDIVDLAVNVAKIKHACQGLTERLDWNEFITPEALRESAPNIILARAYSVVDVARVAAGCVGNTRRDRVLEALRLLEAAEEIAKPDLRENHLSEEDSKADAEHARRCELTELAWKFVRESTTKNGISRSKVLSKVYEWCGRPGDSNAQTKAYLKWASVAAKEWSEICAWRDYVSKHPEKVTPDACAAWRKKWKSSRARFDGGDFLKQFEKPRAKGSAANFLSQDLAVTALAGGGYREFTPLLESWKNTKNQRLLHDPLTKKYVALGDRKNCKTKKNENSS